MEEPIQLIAVGEDGIDLQVNPEAIKELEKYKNKTLVIPAIVGEYRTGKSFLLNMMMNKTTGFALGSTIQAKTKGIWMCIKPHPRDDQCVIVLLDTEGLYDPKKGDNTHDTQIFTLSVLLSSILVFNSKGTITQTGLNNLNMAASLSEHVQVKQGDDDDDTRFAAYFPAFVWAVRDFHLELEADGRTITSNEYLEDCLQLKKGHNQKTTEYNRIRAALTAYFEFRTCFVFPRPASDEDDLNNLDRLTLDQLNPKFIQAGKDFCEHIHDNGPRKMVEGKHCNGVMFGILAREFTEGVKKGVVSIESTFESMKRTVNEESIQSAMNVYHHVLKDLHFPTSTNVVSTAYNTARQSAMKDFQSTVISDKEGIYFNKLVVKLDDAFVELTTINEDESMNKCNLFLEEKGQLIKQEEFHVRGGHQKLCENIKLIEKSYKKLQEKDYGPMLAEAWNNINNYFEQQKEDILKFDNAMNEEDKKKALLQAENDRKEREKEILIQQHKEQEKRQADMQRQFQENMESQRKNLEEQQQRQMDTIREQFQQDKIAQKEMMDELRAQKASADKQMEEDRKAHSEQMIGIMDKLNRPPPKPKGGCCIL